MSHHPQNTGSAIHSAGLTLQAGNNLGNSHLQVFRAGSVCSLTGNEGGAKKEHDLEIALVRAVIGDQHSENWRCGSPLQDLMGAGMISLCLGDSYG